ncbi:MAG: hypothetical protein QM831_39525 [Kofleriaceae bacterium]
MRRLLIALALCGASSPALARSQKTLAYPRPESFSTAVRFVRVDEGLKLVEKDVDAGYILFELHEEKKTFRGSLEVIDVLQDGRHAVRFVMTIEDRPEWQELDMLNRLEKKLRAELGAPAPAPSKKDDPKRIRRRKSTTNPTTRSTARKSAIIRAPMTARRFTISRRRSTTTNPAIRGWGRYPTRQSNRPKHAFSRRREICATDRRCSLLGA